MTNQAKSKTRGQPRRRPDDHEEAHAPLRVARGALPAPLAQRVEPRGEQHEDVEEDRARARSAMPSGRSESSPTDRQDEQEGRPPAKRSRRGAPSRLVRDHRLEEAQRELRQRDGEDDDRRLPHGRLREAEEGRLREVPEPDVDREAGEEQVHRAHPPPQQRGDRDGDRQRAAHERGLRPDVAHGSTGHAVRGRAADESRLHGGVDVGPTSAYPPLLRVSLLRGLAGDPGAGLGVRAIGVVAGVGGCDGSAVESLL